MRLHRALVAEALLHHLEALAVADELVDKVPGMTLLVNHHDPEGQQRGHRRRRLRFPWVGGAADTVILLSRDRQEVAGLVKVTGRDVTEGE
jgi:hypothetical protein